MLSYNTYTSDKDTAQEDLYYISDYIDRYGQGYFTLAQWKELTDPTYYEERREMDWINDMQFGWRHMDSFRIEKGIPGEMRKMYYIRAEDPVPLENRNEVLDVLISRKKSSIWNLEQEILRLEKMKGA